jgi:asparagine synthase (glutamine-hydrolysing)
MCGIAGMWSLSEPSEDLLDKFKKTTERLQFKRGPDAFGSQNFSLENLLLCHNRLAIQELSPLGQQPMSSSCGSYTIVFNGEIYNHLKIRAKIEREFSDICWKGNSDTETLLGAISLWGLQNTLEAIRGMFAFSLWEAKTNSLYFARDIYGEKPMYFAQLGILGISSLVFASDVAVIKEISGNLTISPEIAQETLQLGFIPPECSIYGDVKVIKPGTFVRVQKRTEDFSIVTTNYFKRDKVRKPFVSAKKSTVVDCLEEKLIDAVNSQLISDVPIGTFLSGGIDSSLVTALANECADRKISAFTIGFEDIECDESNFAKEVADCLGVNLKIKTINETDLLQSIGAMPKIYSEPFLDPSQIPTVILCEFAKQDITVALTGDGADELFGGYSRYKDIHSKRQKLKHIKNLIRPFQPTLDGFPIEKIFSTKNSYKIRKLLRYLSADNVADEYLALRSHWQFLNNTKFFQTHDLEGGDSLTTYQDVDIVSYLTNDILVKVDRAAMACSLETRAPFLDREVAETVLEFGEETLYASLDSKWILKDILARRLPRSLFDRPKKGFGIPLCQWLRGPLDDWCDQLVLEMDDFTNFPISKQLLSSYLDDHRRLNADHSYLLWDAFTFLNWMRVNT